MSGPRDFRAQSREDLLLSKSRIEGSIRAAQDELRQARARGDRDEVARLLSRIGRLKSAASAAAVELAIRNQRHERERAFVAAARARLPDDLFREIEQAAAAALTQGPDHDRNTQLSHSAGE